MNNKEIHKSLTVKKNKETPDENNLFSDNIKFDISEDSADKEKKILKGDINFTVDIQDFNRIQKLQGLPEDIISAFYQSKGSIKDPNFLNRIEAYVR
ncbi:MAG: hypothetical protein CVV23_06915 [Ignavibacteriae bacterium HGW-Ignavibacteriae-2]|jgi:hypothetical protein|nr:MAG: hypothetical protein CVV23_06915 [Ignavibacteriae bacterium HGW-Ignavibacteriae-2]